MGVAGRSPVRRGSPGIHDEHVNAMCIPQKQATISDPSQMTDPTVEKACVTLLSPLSLSLSLSLAAPLSACELCLVLFLFFEKKSAIRKSSKSSLSELRRSCGAAEISIPLVARLLFFS